MFGAVLRDFFYIVRLSGFLSFQNVVLIVPIAAETIGVPNSFSGHFELEN